MADRSIAYRFTANVRGLTSGLALASRSVADLGNRLTATDRQGERMRRGLNTLGDSAGKLGLAAAVGLGVMIKTAASFEQNMSKVQAATHETAGNMEELRAAALKAGADTAFSANEAAQGIEALSKAGLKTKDILAGGLTGALDLAAAGTIDVSEAADIAATTLNQFKLSGDQTSHVADVLAAAAGKAQGEVTDMAGALKYVGPVAAQMGISLEETSGAIALLATQGILGEQAGTSLRGMLTSLTSPSKVASEQLDALGISLYDAQGNFVGLDGIAGQLKSTMSGLTNAERDQALGRIFGNEQITAARILYAGGAEAVQDWTKQVNDSGYASETAATKLDNLAGDLEAFKGSLETAFIGAGSGAQGPLRGLVQGATDAVNAFTKLPGPVQSTATALLAVTAVTGGAAFFGAKIIGGIASTKLALSQLGVTARTTTAALTGVGKGLQFAAIVFGVQALDNALADLGNRRLEGDLERNLTALANNEVVGNLDKIGGYVRSLNSSFAEGQNTTFGWLPGKTEFSEAADEIKKVDEALAQLVESGQQDQALKIFDKITEQSKAEGIGIGETTKVFTAYQLALKNSAAEADKAAVATDGLSVAADVVGPSLTALRAEQEAQAEASKAQAEAFADARKAARDTAEQFFGLGDSLDDSKVSLDGWIADLEKQTQALRDLQSNAKEAANKGLRQGLIRALEEAGPAGALRLGQLADASETQIRRANKAFQSGNREVGDFAKTLTKVKSPPPVDLSVNAAAAQRVINGIAYDLSNLKDKTVYINTINRRGGAGGQGPATTARAEGGYISGPGSGTSDSIPARLSNGEYVMKASAVQRYGVNMFDGLNAERFAKGGRVGNVTDVTAFSDGSRDLDVPGLRGMRRGLAALERSLASSTDAVDASKDAVDRETSARDSLASEFGSLKSSIADMFNSELFQPLNDVFGSNRTTSDPISVLLSDIANSDQFSSLFAGLAARGLSGDALTAAARGGTAGLQAVGAYSDADLARYADLYAKRESARNNAGEQVAQARYAQALADQTNRLDAVSAELAYQTAQNDQLIAAVRDSKRATDEVVEATKGNGASVARGSRNRKGRG